MIILSNISKSFNNNGSFAVQNVSLTVPEGKTLVLLGSSGSGKSTLLKMINRLITPTSGEIKINNKDINDYDPIQLRRQIGYVFQQIGLFPHLSVEKNIMLVLRLQGMNQQQRQRCAYEFLNSVDLDPAKFAKRYPEELSGGQQQRVGVARALAAKSQYLLMDEPFGAVDAITRDHLQQLLINLREKFKKTIIFVTHDIEEAIRLGDEIAVMHQGCLQQVGSAKELTQHPKNKFVSELFSKQAGISS